MDEERTMNGRGRASATGSTIGWLALLLSLAVIVAACGNGDDDAATDAPESTDAPAAAETEADTGNDTDTGSEDVDADAGSDDEAAADAGNDDESAADAEEAGVPDAIANLASETGSATVTIGDETFEFSLAGTKTVGGTTHVGRCETLFGMIIGSGFVTDDRDITLDLEVPPVDWDTYEDERFDPPAVEVEDNETNADWVADVGDEFTAGSGVGEYEQEGATASGSATFVNSWDPESEPVEGTFEVDCKA
jgi:hypothetical protein